MKYKTSFLINLVGLSTGLACALVIYMWVSDELSVDRFHENKDELYQVFLNYQNQGGNIETYDWTPAPLANALAEEIPEISSAVTVFSEGSSKNGIISKDDKSLIVNDLYVGDDYFNIFSFDLIEGQEDQVLSGKNTVLISKEIAIKLFNTSENIIGKSIEWNKEKFTGTYDVSGVFENHIKSRNKSDVVFNFDLYKDKNPDIDSWDDNDPSTFILLEKETDIASLQGKIENLVQENIGNKPHSLFIQKYTDQYLNGEYQDGAPSGGRITYVQLFSLIAIIILLIASINFMNLSTAKTARRIKEIGIKKAMGANRKILVSQYLSESVILSFISLSFAVLLVAIILPQFNEITGKQLSFPTDAKSIFAILSISAITGLISGSYPALFLSGLNPVKSLSGVRNSFFGEFMIRKGLVVFQLIASIVLIFSVVVVYKQLDLVLSKDLGYDKDNILLVKREGNLNADFNSFLQEIKNIPGVINSSSYNQSLVNNRTGTNGLSWEGKTDDQNIVFKYMHVNYNFIETLGIELNEGRTFSRDFPSDESKIIFNQAAIESMGIVNPIGKTIIQWGQEKEIVGVVDNFHFESLYEPLKPCFLNLSNRASNFAVKIHAGREKETISAIEDLYGEFNPGIAMNYQFMDENYQEFYQAEQQISLLARYFAGLAIIISCLGLFGLTVFAAERRQKEISIRKVLGSSVANIVALLTSGVATLVVVSLIISLPIGYLITNKWLNDFSYRIEINSWFYLSVGATVFLITFLTVGIQSMKAALSNPTNFLRAD